MREDTEIPSKGAILQNGEHVQILTDNNYFTEDSSSICALILDSSSNIAYIPVMSISGSEEVVMFDVVDDDDDDDIEVEIAEENEICVKEEPHTTKSVIKPRQGHHVCKTCNKSFSQAINLVTHERIHTGEKPFKCSVCSKLFSQQPNLWKHMRIHTGERPYQCVTCNKSFTQQANLKKHLRIHTGERPYACVYCGRCFTQQANLTKHVRLHTGERPFHCAYCTKTFVQQSNLERHERTHTGIKPFQCKICSECFAQNAHLSKHLRTVHRNTYLADNNKPFVKKEVLTTDCDESEISPQTVDVDQYAEIQPKMCIPVLYCTKTGRILRRVD